MSLIAEWIGVSRAALYKSRNRFDSRQDLREQIVEFVRAERLINKKIGGVKLHICFLRDHPQAAIGRDRFLTVLRDANLLMRKKRPRTCRSSSLKERQGRVDLAHKLAVAGPGHLLVNDDTEVITSQGKAHLALSTDAYSHKLVGYSWSERANSEHTEVAFKMVLTDQACGKMDRIHHSDNGSIYASRAYQLLLKEAGYEVSWTPPGRPDRNPIAERINLTFKEEYLCDSSAKSFNQIAEDLPGYIRHYNERRPHMSCNNGYPKNIYNGIGIPKKLWKQRPPSYPYPSRQVLPPSEKQ